MSGAVPTVTAKIIGDVSFINFIVIATVFSILDRMNVSKLICPCLFFISYIK